MTYSTVHAATVEELEIVRRAGQWSKLFLAMFKPSIVYTARLASLPSSFDRVVEIAFNTGSGTLTDVLPDMTMYVGSTAGAYDLGMVRIRKAPIAGTFYIGEVSDVTWEAACYLTVTNEVDIWAKHINTVDDETFYMDVDVVYTDQNSVFNPVPIMGSNRAVRLEGASVSTQFDWTNSYCLNSSISSYSATCATASATAGLDTGTPTLTFDTEGWHMVVLTVTAANGKTSVGIRYVYVYSDAVPPVTVFQLGSCFEDYEVGGWSFSATLQSGMDIADVPERTLCILFGEDYYGDEKVSVGQLPGCENIICTGKISDEVYGLNPEQPEVTIQVQGMQFWMSQVHAFPTGVLLKNSTPTNWVEMQTPTVDEVLFRLLYWGSTVIKVMDVYLTNDTRIASELISPASNIWAQMQELAFATIHARTGVDRFGRLFVVVEPQVTPVASRTWPSVFTLTKKDWEGQIRLQRSVISSVGVVNSSGVVVASNGDGSALFSLSPGHVFKRYGTPEVLDRLLLSTQLLSNQLAGLVLGWRNNPYPNVEISLAGNYRLIDCFPSQKIAWSFTSLETPRGVSVSGNFIPRRVEFRWDENSGLLQTFIAVEMESVQQLYVNGDIPGSGDYDPADPPAPPAFPPLPDFPVIVPGFPSDPDAAVPVLAHDTEVGLVYTENINVEIPTWITVNSGLTIGQYQSITQMVVTPSGAVYVACCTGGGNEFIAYAPSIGGTFTIVEDSSTIAAKLGAGTAYGVLAIGLNSLTGVVGYVIGRTIAAFNYEVFLYTGTGTTFAQGAHLAGVGSGMNNASFANLTYGFGKWLFTSCGDTVTDKQYWRISGDGSTLETVQDIGDGSTAFHIRASTTGITWHFRRADETLDKGTNNCAVVTNVGSLLKFGAGTKYAHNQIAVDPTGSYMMAQWTTSTTSGKSSDGGATWVSAGAIPAGGRCYAYAGPGESGARFVAAGATVYWTPNFGVDWYNRTGNLGSISATPEIDLVKAIGY